MKNTNLFLLGIVLFLASCNKKPQPSLEIPQETMDRVEFVFVPYDENNQLRTDTLRYSYDLFHESDAAYALEKGRKYLFLIEIFNAEEKVHDEIEQEGEEHQFFFFTELEDFFISFSYADEDSNGNAIGLKNIIELGENESSSNFHIVLRHGLDKFHPNAQVYDDENYRDAGGSDDLNLSLLLYSVAF